MKICAVQFRPTTGSVERNLASHFHWIEAAAAEGAALVFFPELSLTGYEPKLAAQLAVRPTDPRLDGFQQLSDARGIVISIGVSITRLDGETEGLVIIDVAQSPHKAQTP